MEERRRAVEGESAGNCNERVRNGADDVTDTRLVSTETVARSAISLFGR